MWNGHSSAVVDLPTWKIWKIISTGNLACHSNIKKNGVSCMVVRNDVLRASCMNGKTPAQIFYALLLYLESMACRVECIRSDTELP